MIGPGTGECCALARVEAGTDISYLLQEGHPPFTVNEPR
jgi:hypothetical protein